MEQEKHTNYNRIAKAIAYIQVNFKEQPSLDEIAEQAHLSPFHFQRLFKEWAGVSPKRFIQYLSINYAKELIRFQSPSLFEVAAEVGLSGTSRLHDLFVTIEGMTPGEYKNGGEYLQIKYDFTTSPFGHLLIASTTKGVCHLSFFEDKNAALNTLFLQFPKANYCQATDHLQQLALQFFQKDWESPENVKLHLKGTPFQIKVWEALLKIPFGQLSTYGNVAEQIGNSKASRAVGTAIGRNPIAFLIPCHRVIQSSGHIGEYRWGSTRKAAITGWEAAVIG